MKRLIDAIFAIVAIEKSGRGLPVSVVRSLPHEHR